MSDPVQVTFNFNGNLAEEVERVTLGIKGLNDESAQTFRRLIAESTGAFDSLSADNRRMALAVQENINALRDLSALQDALDKELEAGDITTRQYTQAKAALAMQEKNLREEIRSGMQALDESMATEQQAIGSIASLRKQLQELVNSYQNLSKAEREGATGRALLERIGALDGEVAEAQATLDQYSRTASGGFNNLSMSVQQVARELPSLTMGANTFFLAVSNNLPMLADNIRQARREYEQMRQAGQKGVPVWKQLIGSIFSWQTALVVGITVLSMYGKEIIAWAKSLATGKKSLADTLETLEEFHDKVSDTSAATITELQRMAKEWDALGANLSAKEKYILENQSAFDKLGVSINNTSDAEQLFTDGKQAFVDSVMARAKAAAAMEMSAEQYKKAIRKMQEADQMEDGRERSYWNYAGAANGGFQKITFYEKNQDKVKAEEQARSLLAEADGLVEKYIGYTKESAEKMKEAGLSSADAMVEGSVAQIEASIQIKQEALKQLTNKADYDKALEEIKAEQKKLEAITGQRGGKKDEPAPFGSLKYYDDLIAKTRKLREEAVTDVDRKKFDDQIKLYQEKMAEMENQIILSGKNIAVETLKSSLEGLKLNIKFDNRNELEKAFGKFDTSDLEALRKKVDKELNTPIEEAREGIALLIEDWKNLSDADRASAIADECYNIADGLAMAAETAELFNSTLGSSLATVSQLVGSVGDMAGGVARALSGDLIGGASGILSGVTGIIGSFKRRVEENKKILAEYNQKLVETAMKELEYNSILRERLRIQQQIGETTLDYFDRQSTELKRQAGQIEKEYREVFAKLQKEQYVTETHYKHGTWFRKAKTWNDYDSLAGKSYEEMESLYTQGKLTESAETLFEQLRKLKEEGADVADMIDSLNEEMKGAFTGTTVDSIADSIIRGFAEGRRSAKDFADDFQEMLNTAVLQGVKMKALEEPLRQWYESFAEASGNGLTAESIAELREQYDQIIEDAARQLEDMEKVTGTTIGDIADAGRTATAQGIASMSQESASELNGNFYALLIYADKTAQGVANINTLLLEGLTLMARIARNTDRLETIEKELRATRSAMQDIQNKGLVMRKS